MSCNDSAIPRCLGSLINWISGEGTRSFLGSQGLWLLLEKISLRGAGAAGLRGEGAGVSTKRCGSEIASSG